MRIAIACLVCCFLGTLGWAAEIPPRLNLGQGTRRSLTSADFETERTDGCFDRTLGFARDYLRRMRPEYSFDAVSNKAGYAAWRGKVRAKLGELLQIPSELPRPEFRQVALDMRDGYRIERYEFMPEPRLVVLILLLVPEEVVRTGRRVPAVICLPGSGASLSSLAGEPDRYACRYPIRNKQAWYYVQAGMVAVAMENPGTAENGVPGVNHYVVQDQVAGLMALSGRSMWGFMTEHVLETVGFLKEHRLVSPDRIAVSGMSLGCIAALYSAVLSDDISAVVYNDYAGSWAARAIAVTERPKPHVDVRRPFGFHRWFDDQPDLMAALAPRPLLLAEGGAWKGVIEKVSRAYTLVGAAANLRVAYYDKYADAGSRRFEGEAVSRMSGLTDEEYLLRSNVDARQHSFHPERNVPWLCERLFGTFECSDALRREIERAKSEEPLAFGS